MIDTREVLRKSSSMDAWTCILVPRTDDYLGVEGAETHNAIRHTMATTCLEHMCGPVVGMQVAGPGLLCRRYCINVRSASRPYRYGWTSIARRVGASRRLASSPLIHSTAPYHPHDTPNFEPANTSTTCIIRCNDSLLDIKCIITFCIYSYPSFSRQWLLQDRRRQLGAPRRLRRNTLHGLSHPRLLQFPLWKMKARFYDHAAT